MIVEARFIVPAWTETTAQKAVSFWQGRDMTVRETEPGALIGTRGSLWGNLTSFKAREVLTKLMVNVYFAEVLFTGDEVHCVLDVTTAMTIVFPSM